MTAATSPPAFKIPLATARSSGPQPTTSVRRPGSMFCDFNKMVAAARPMTPGVVQPAKGMTRSVVPVATSNALGNQLTDPSGLITSVRRLLPTFHTLCPKRQRTPAWRSSWRKASPSRASTGATIPGKRPKPSGKGRQTCPPASLFSSTSTTLSPLAFARSAARAPAGPAPITSKSILRKAELSAGLIKMLTPEREGLYSKARRHWDLAGWHLTLPDPDQTLLA